MTQIKVATLPLIFHDDIDYYKIKYVNVNSLIKLERIKYIIIENDTIDLLDFFVENDIDIPIGIRINKNIKFDSKKLKHCISKLMDMNKKIFVFNANNQSHD